MSIMKLSTDDTVNYWIFRSDKLVNTGIAKVKGFYCYGMWVEGCGVWPFFSDRSWYAAGFYKQECVIYLKHKWMLSRAIIFELVRLERWGRIFFWHEEPNQERSVATGAE